jgi:hypothetical protein
MGVLVVQRLVARHTGAVFMACVDKPRHGESNDSKRQDPGYKDMKK